MGDSTDYKILIQNDHHQEGDEVEIVFSSVPINKVYELEVRKRPVRSAAT